MKKHKFKILTFVAVAAALAGTGCFKSIGYETFYVLRPWAQEGTVKTPIPREDMLAYAFDADTTEWSVLSYEDAVAGIITSRRTGEKLRPIAQGEPYEIDGNENWLAMQLNGPRFLILAVDQSNRLYGFTEQAIGENLPQMHVSVTFYPKEKGKRFLKGKWIMCNDFYTEPEPEPEPEPAPEPEPEPCVPADCSSYSIASLSAIVGQCGHPKNYSTCSPGCDQPTKYACLYPKADIESTWKYTRENCPEPNELSDGKTFEFAGGATETRYKVCRCPTAYNKTDATCKNINTSEVAGASGNIVCSERSKPVSGSDPTFTPASCGSILGLDESDVCVDKETNVTYGKYCKCDGPSYSSSSCPNTTALVCKTSTSTNWQYIKCL